jgi:Uncharacterized protein involved in propionate catabolism
MGNKDKINQFAERIVNTKYEDLTEREILYSKLSLLDLIGVTLAGTTQGNMCQKLVKFAKDQGGTKEATLWGYGGKLPAMMAAFANGSVNHSLDFDQCFDISGTHPGVSTVPSAVALMEKTNNLSGKELLVNMTTSCDFVYRVARAISVDAQKSYGVFAAFAYSFFGASAAAGRALKLDVDQMVNCIGLGFGQLCGNMQVLYETDCNIREIFPAFGNKAGVLAACLAKEGVNGIKNVLEGPAGFFNAFGRGDYDPEKLIVKAGDPFMNVQVTTKPYPSCRQTHMFVDATRLIVEENSIKATDIDNVTLRVGKFGEVLCIPEKTRRKPPLPMDAKFSNIYCVAAYLTRGKLGVAEFNKESLKDPEILKLASEIKFERDDENIDMASSLVEPGGVTIHCKDGREFTKYVTASLGSPDNPMTKEDVISKFKDCAAYSIKTLSNKDIDMIIDMCLNLDQVNDIRKLIEIFS